MAREALSDLMLKRLTPPEAGRIEISDGRVPGLKFRLTPAGHASWSIQVNIGSRKRRFTIGDYPAIGLAEARKRGQRLRVQAQDGSDPILERRARANGGRSVLDAVDEYAEIHLRPNLRTSRERERQLRKALSSHLDLQVSELTKGHLQAAIDRKAKSGSRFAANRIRAALMAFSAWSWRRGYLAENIGLGTSRMTAEQPRDRVMTIEEVRAVLRASYELGPLWGPLVRILTLTGQRRGDVAGMRWSELELERQRWSIPGRRTKNKRPHIVHLSDPVVAELRELKRVKSAAPETSDLLFTTTGTSPVSGFGKVKERLDQIVQLPDWRFHDLRTAFASALCDRGEPEGVVDRVLNHAASGSAPSAVARVYNQSEYLPQRARALNLWAELIVTGGTGLAPNVTSRSQSQIEGDDRAAAGIDT